MKVTSGEQKVNTPIEKLFDRLSNFAILDAMKVKDKGFEIEILNDQTCRLKTEIAGDVDLTFVEKERPNKLVLAPVSAPIASSLLISLKEFSKEESVFEIFLDIDVPFFMTSVVKKPMQEMVDKLSELFLLIGNKK